MPLAFYKPEQWTKENKKVKENKKRSTSVMQCDLSDGYLCPHIYGWLHLMKMLQTHQLDIKLCFLLTTILSITMCLESTNRKKKRVNVGVMEKNAKD